MRKNIIEQALHRITRPLFVVLWNNKVHNSTVNISACTTFLHIWKLVMHSLPYCATLSSLLLNLDLTAIYKYQGN